MGKTIMKREIRTPVWRNEEKNSISCKIAIIGDDGSEVEHNGVVSKYGEGENINPDWLTVIDQYGIEDIDQRTEEIIAEHEKKSEERANIREEELKRRKERKKQEDLFTTKLEIFEIPEVKESTNRSAKSKIRKAKTKLQSFAYAVKLLIEEENKQTSETDDSTTEEQNDQTTSDGE